MNTNKKAKGEEAKAKGEGLTRDEVMACLKETLAAEIGITPYEVKDETTLEQLGLDSLDRIEWMMVVEDALGISIDDEVTLEARTVGEIAEAIVGKAERSSAV